MSEKVKNNQDKNLIKKCFGYEPLDWARYEDGTLAVINPAGQKNVYSPEELDQILEVAKEATKRKRPISSNKNKSALNKPAAPGSSSATPKASAKPAKKSAAAAKSKKPAADPKKKSGAAAEK